MKFTELPLPGAWVVDVSPIHDARGFFARTFCEEQFGAQGLVSRFSQASASFNIAAGTVRGMHFQRAPAEETKIVRCVAGAVLDVLVDLRPASPTYLRSASVELSAGNRRAVYIPAGLAHGFQTLAPDSELHYLIDKPYVPALSAGVRWDDPAFDVAWPLPISVIADKDRGFADWVK